MKALSRSSKFMVAAMLLSGCTGLPPLTLHGDRGADAPAGPKVASLVANLKCELWDAANSRKLLRYYRDDLAFKESPVVGQKNHALDEQDARAFNLRNIMSEIEYVGEATFTLDVTHAGAFNPSASLSKFYRGPVGELPATGALLTVGGQFSETAHRYVTFYSSADFSRLVPAGEDPFATEASGPLGGKPIQHTPVSRPSSCDQGSELQGDLGLKETLAIGITAAAMNDIAVFPAVASGSVGSASATVIPVPSIFPVGQISGQIDFTIVENINGGPTWNLAYFKGPGGNGAGLFNAQRQVKDTLVVTFVPVCIRSGRWTNSPGPPFRYSPEMVDGTPGWANYLPLCDSAYHLQAQASALSQAKSNNDQILLQNSPLFRQ